MTTLLTLIAYAAFAVAFLSGLVAMWTWPSHLPAATSAGLAAAGPNGGEAGKASRRTFSHPIFDIEVTR